MQYIPVEAPPFPLWLSLLFFVALALCFVAMVFLWAHVFKLRPGFRRGLGIFGIVILYAGCLAAAFFGVRGLIPNFNGQTKAIQMDVEASYDLKLTENEVLLLKYPSSEPEVAFEAFGSVEKMLKTADSYAKSEIYLIWDEGKMLLAESETGEDFTPLKSKMD